jgi:diguanylate cyclase (GGDEF)-like protein/PAS domain S-box-containing protein
MSIESRSSRRPNLRRTIGYVSTLIYDDPSQPQWSGVVDAARKHDVNLVCFAGRNLHSPIGFESQANILYDLVSAEGVDGIVSWASSIGNYVTREETRHFHTRYRPLPIVSIGMTLEGIPSLLMDSYGGMRQALVHLIEHHGYRRIAFLRGPSNHLYAQERYRAFTETLEEYGLSLNPDLVTPPSGWAHANGVTAAGILLDERGLRPGIDFQAIVGANDHLMLGALQLLQLRGVHVPGEVAAVGFNDTFRGKMNVPPLTSVAAPFYQLGYQAVENVLALLDGQNVPEETIAPAKLAIRQSCGCLDPRVAQAATASPGSRKQVGKSIFDSRRKEILSAMVLPAGESLRNDMGGWVERLLTGFAAEVEKGASGAFLGELNQVLSQVNAANEDVSRWHGVLSGLRQETIPFLDDESLWRAENILQQARVMVGETARRQQAHQGLRDGERAQMLRDISTALITTFDIEGLMDTLAQSLPRLGIPSCCLALYENPQPYQYPQSVPEWSRLILAFTEKGRVSIGPGGRRFRSRELVPDGILTPERQFGLVLESLYFQEKQLGFVLFEIGPGDGAVYGTLRSQISSALEGALLLEERKQVENALKTSQTQLRTIADSLPVLIAQIGLDQHYLFVNKTCADWLGIKPEQAVGKHMSQVLGEARYALVRESIDRALAGEHISIDQELNYKNGAIRFVHASYIPHQDERGQVDSYFELSEDITTRKEMEQRLHQLATTDALTGLHNRRYFIERGKEELLRAVRYNTAICLLSVDVDHFKGINDSQGHAVGDRVLQQLGTTLPKILRNVDIVGRLGGEEFSVLLPNTSLNEAGIIAERIRRSIERLVFKVHDGELHITVSCGVASFHPDAPSLDALLKHADIALYQAKESGRNCIVTYSEALSRQGSPEKEEAHDE